MKDHKQAIISMDSAEDKLSIVLYSIYFYNKADNLTTHIYTLKLLKYSPNKQIYATIKKTFNCIHICHLSLLIA